MKHHISDLLDLHLPTHRWELQLLQKWPLIIGELQEHVHIEKIQPHGLVLGVYDSSWLHELYMLSPLILKKINEHLEPHVIKELRFKQTVKKKAQPSRRTHHAQQHAPINTNLSSRERTALTTINDAELKDALMLYLSRCKRTA